MAYSNMANQVTGYLVTATEWNKIGDNFREGVPDIFTTAGDITYGTAADTSARLGIGAAGTMLQPITGLPAWSNIRVNTLVRQTSQQDFTTSTLGNVTEMVQAIGSSEVWFVKWYLALDTTTTGGFKFAVTVPASATLAFFGHWSTAVTSAVVLAGYTTTGGSAICGAGTGGATKGYTDLTAVVVNSTNAGNIQLQMAQNGAAGTSSVLVNSMQVSRRIS